MRECVRARARRVIEGSDLVSPIKRAPIPKSHKKKSVSVVPLRHMVMASLTLLLSLAATAPPSTPIKSIVSFGDSWAWLGYDQFRDVFSAHGVNTSLRAIPGTPAAYWAVIEPNALIEAVEKANADAVYLSIGGNDYLEGLPLGHAVELLHAEMMKSTQVIIDTLLKAKPHVQIYHFGYELLDWDSCEFCKEFGITELKGPKPWLCPDTSNVTCMTTAQTTWLQHKFIDDGLKAIYKNTPNYHGLNLLGTLQVAGGVSGARVGHPVMSQYSPEQYVRKATGSLSCVHLTKAGYTALYKEFVKHVLSSAVEEQ